MTIEIHRPELEAPIEQRMRTGAFQNIDDLLMYALKSTPEDATPKYQRPPGKKSLAQLFAESPFRGLDLDCERSHDTLRPADL